MIVEQVELRRLNLPLHSPYRLSSVSLDSFDVIFATVSTADGDRGIGEVTPLTGYSEESIEEAWKLLTDIARDIVGMDVKRARERTIGRLESFRFSSSAILTALDSAKEVDVRPVTAPLVGILSTDDPEDQRRAKLSEQIEAGYETIKVKVGFDPAIDASVLGDLVDRAPLDTKFRVDANRAYSYRDAKVFLDSAPLDRIQLLEQPMPVGNLGLHADLREGYSVPIMLDEEVAAVEDVESVAENGAADIVKFKLMKCGGYRETIRLIQCARENRLEVVIGNGVQTGVGCVHEALLWEETDLTLAGEFNGWEKLREVILPDSLSSESGNLVWDANRIRLDERVCKRYERDRLVIDGVHSVIDADRSTRCR